MRFASKTLATLYFAKFLCPGKGKPAEAPYLKKDGSNPGFTHPILGSKGASEAGESGDGRCELLLSVSAENGLDFHPMASMAIFMGTVMINIDKTHQFSGVQPYSQRNPNGYSWCRAPRMASPTPCPVDLWICVALSVQFLSWFLCNDVDEPIRKGDLT